MTSRMALIQHLVEQGERLCAGNGTMLFDFTVASPGFVLLLYLNSWDGLEAMEADDTVKAAAKRVLQDQVTQLLTLVLEVVQSPDPRLTLVHHGATVAEALEMGRSPSDEVH